MTAVHDERPVSLAASKRRLADLYALRRKVNAEIAAERRAVAQAFPLDGRRSTARCGTDGGYFRHLRTLHDVPCQPCRAAHAAVERERQERVRRTAAEVADNTYRSDGGG